MFGERSIGNWLPKDRKVCELIGDLPQLGFGFSRDYDHSWRWSRFVQVAYHRSSGHPRQPQINNDSIRRYRRHCSQELFRRRVSSHVVTKLTQEYGQRVTDREIILYNVNCQRGHSGYAHSRRA